MWCFVPEAASGQHSGPGTAWSSSVNFNGVTNGSEDTWAFDAKEADGGELVVVGYVEVDGTASSGCEGLHNDNNRVPGYAVIDKSGKLVTSSFFKTNPVTGHNGPGSFSEVTKVSDGFVIAGHQRAQTSSSPCGFDNGAIFLVKINNAFQQVWTKTFTIPEATDPYFAASVSASTSVDAQIFVSGKCGPGFIAAFNADGTSAYYRLATNLVPNMENGNIAEIKLVPENNPTHVIFTGNTSISSTQMTPPGALNSTHDVVNVAGVEWEDLDVFVGSIPLATLADPSNIDQGFVKYFNSKLGFNGQNTHTLITTQYPITCPGQYGPCTPGKSLDCASPAVDAYLTQNSRDEGRSIVQIGDVIYAAVEFDITLLTAAKHVGFHYWEIDGNGVHSPGAGINLLPCDGHKSDEYKDAYIYILKINANTGALIDAKNVAHFSGGDFSASLIVDRVDGNLVLGGTTSDKNICGLPDAEGAESNMLIKIDPNLNTVWQQHYLINGGEIEGTCAFGLLQSADNGFIVIGNQETEDGDETFNITKFTSDCQYLQSKGGTFFIQDGDHTLAQDETWTPANKPNPYHVRGNIIVPAGKKLVITNGLEVQFAYTKNDVEGKKTGITVQPGGKLYVSNGTVLKGINCGGEQMWDGITVEGIPTQGAGVLQGYVSVTGTTTRIENAVRGIVLGGTGWEVEESNHPVGGAVGTVLTNVFKDDHGKGGGRLFAIYGTFRNCGKGVVWNPMNGPGGQPASNMSHLLHTKFEFTTPLVDDSYKASNQGPSKEAVASELGCQLRSVKDVIFTNISCINTMADGLFPVQHTRPSGIYAVDSKFTVNGGAANPHYGKLYVGVESSSVLGGAASTLSITSKFDRVYQGVNVRTNITPVISGCQFNHIPDKTDSESGDPTGVHSVGTQGILLSANYFDSQADYDNYAARIDNSLGTGGAKVEFNTFTDMNVGNRFENDNTSLQTHCNTYQGAVGDVSWDVRGVIANQQNPFSTSEFPDNKFIWVCGSPLLDIGSVPSFTYKERKESQFNTNSILKCFTSTVSIPFTTNDAAPNCAIEDPCPNPPYCNTLLGLYSSSGNALPYRNDLLGAYVRMSPYAVADSLYLPGTTRAISLLGGRNQQEDKRILTATYASLGNYTTAQQYLQQVSGATTETQDFIAYYTILISAGLAGRDAYHLTATEFSQLSPLMTHATTMAEQVKVLDHILNGVYHPLHAELGAGNRSGENSENADVPIVSMGLSVSPNPFSNEVRFVATEGVSVMALTITDISGKVIFERKFASSEPMIIWSASNLSDGILFYRCTLSNGLTAHGKLLYSKKQ